MATTGNASAKRATDISNEMDGPNGAASNG